MSDSEPHSARPAWFYVLLYTLGGVLAAGGLICMALQFAIPEVRGLSGTGAAFFVVAAVIVASVHGQRKMDRIRRDILEHHAVAEEVKQLTLVRLETYMQAIRAEARDMYERGMKEIDGRLAAMERDLYHKGMAGLRALAFTGVDEENVFPLPSQETRDAAQRLARRIIQREEEGR